MKEKRHIQSMGLPLLLLAAVTACFYTRVSMAWNVPFYALAMAAIFLEGAAAFAQIPVSEIGRY